MVRPTRFRKKRLGDRHPTGEGQTAELERWQVLVPPSAAAAAGRLQQHYPTGQIHHRPDAVHRWAGAAPGQRRQVFASGDQGREMRTAVGDQHARQE